MKDKTMSRETNERILARGVAFEIPEEELKAISGGSGDNSGVQTPETTGYNTDLDYDMN